MEKKLKKKKFSGTDQKQVYPFLENKQNTKQI